ncbi:MAG: signal recognition particle protein [Ignavibacteria bacterium]|jgi:signal recognition particle subunit SRP54|nr:signal recognition particle protein [Ignavibacteria bacterium]MDH7526768.1 signal recognition particle protein [Ignavibacteria bacterium]
MFEELTQKLESAFKKIRGQGKLTEKNISDALREVRRILIDADVNYKVAKEFIEKVEKKSLGKEVISSITPGQLIIKIINDELIDLLGGTTSPLVFANTPPSIYLLAGLQGSGKTTFAAKFSNYLKQAGLKPLLVACDIYRPAAVEQLKQLGKQINVEVFHQDKNAVEIAKYAIEYAKENGFNAIVIDTAGRLHIDEEMMEEIAKIKEVTKPTETYFVVDSMTGQDAVNTAKAFHDKINYDGIVLTKLDGDTRGGCALSIRAVVNKPIKFVSLGEKLDSIEVFHPDRMASRILGKGDIVTLVEKAQSAFEEKEAKRLEEKLRSNKFDFEDFRDQLKIIKRLGSLSQILSMIPGLSSIQKNVQVDEKAFVKVEAIINSMTKEERRNPRILNASRKRRIAKGSGTSIQEVNRLVKQFEEMQKMIKKLNNMDFNKAFRNFNLKLN